MRNAYFRQYRDLPSIAAMMQSIHERTTFVTIRFPLPRIASHIEDDAVIATAVQGGTDYLVTGDRALQQLERVERVRIVESGRECLPRLV